LTDQTPTNADQPTSPSPSQGGPQGTVGGESPSSPPPAAPGEPAWAADLDRYPLRPPAEDPGWAIKTVWIWVVFAVASFLFMVTLLVLGALVD